MINDFESYINGHETLVCSTDSATEINDGNLVPKICKKNYKVSIFFKKIKFPFVY